jgi:hypothetical protein
MREKAGQEAAARAYGAHPDAPRPASPRVAARRHDDPVLRHRVAGQPRPVNPPLAHHEDAVAKPDQLRQFGRDDDDADTLLGQVAQDAVDLGLGADVDAPRRLVEEDHLRIDREQLGERHLLLIAARQARHAAAPIWPYLRRRDSPSLRASVASLVVDDAERARHLRRSSAETLAATDMSRNTPSALPVLRQVDDARAMQSA